MRHLKANILDVRSGYILQQCNCITVRGLGLSADLSRQFPGTCPYDSRRPVKPGLNICREEDRSEPGTVMIIGYDTPVRVKDTPQIINLFGQYAPGKPKPYSQLDKVSDRERYFSEGLNALVDFFEGKDIIDIAVPYKIGCRLAGGDWTHYEKMLLDFENKSLQKGLNVRITVYHLP